jgi:small subunit ribosomal protein S21
MSKDNKTFKTNQVVNGPSFVDKPFLPIEVRLRGNYGDNFEAALRAFKAMVQKEKILAKYKERQSYEKPSVKKRRKIKEAREKRMSLEAKAKALYSDADKNKAR